MICNKCNDDKIEDDFSFKNKSKGIRQKQCKSCVAEYRKVYYETNKGVAISSSTESSRMIRQRNRQYIWDYLSEHPCIDCGNDNPIVLDFDHRDDVDKVKNVSELSTQGWSVERIQSEIDKCDVRCANCHRERTAIQQGWYKDVKKEKKLLDLAFLEPWLGWEEVVETDIDFDSLKPVRTGDSLHIYSEEYEVDGYTYRLLYEISDVNGKPMIERKKMK